MSNGFSEHLHYYILLSLFGLLFVLQIWAMLKIKLMLQRVLEIYKRMQQMAARQRLGEAQPSHKVNVNYKQLCEYCRHRETFLAASGKNVFIYQCDLSKQRIKLDDCCAQFEFDPHRAQI